MKYTPLQVYVEPKQEERLKKTIEGKKGISIKISFTEPKYETVLFTKDQIQRIERVQLMGKTDILIKTSAPQVKANTMHHGGFLWSLAARFAPAIVIRLWFLSTEKWTLR